LFQAHLGEGFIAVALDNPIFVVSALKLQEGLAHLLDGGEGSHPEEIFLEDADKALGAAVAFRGPDKGGRALDSPEGNFFLKIMRPILAAMIMPRGQALGGQRCKVAEILSDPLFDGFQGLEAGAAFGGMNTHALHGVVIHCEEDRRLAFCGRKSYGHIGAPHVIDPGGGDGAVMDSGPRATAPAVRRPWLRTTMLIH